MADMTAMAIVWQRPTGPMTYKPIQYFYSLAAAPL